MSQRQSTLLDRRRFLLASSACAVAATYPVRPTWAMATTDRATPSLVLAYRPSGEDPPYLVGDAPLVAAESLASGDARLARGGARVAVHGLLGEAGMPAAGIRSSALHVSFPRRFSPWSFASGAVSRAAGAVEFFVPVDAERGLELTLEVDRDATFGDRLLRLASGRARREWTARLQVGGERRAPKLREGVYLIPLDQEAYREPASRRCREVGDDPCLVLSIDAA